MIRLSTVFPTALMYTECCSKTTKGLFHTLLSNLLWAGIAQLV